MRLDRGAAGRLVELRQSERGLQAETARAPISCDRNGGAIGVFGSDGMFGFSLQQDVAADPVEEGVGPTLTRPPRQRHRFINMRQGCFSPLPFDFELREPAQKMREEAPESLIGIFHQSFAHLRHAGIAIAQSSARPAPAKRSEIEEPREPVSSRNFDQSLRVAQSSLRVSTEHFERRLESVYVDQRGDVSQFDCARNRVID